MANGTDPLDQTINPLYPPNMGGEQAPLAPQTQYNTLRSGLPAYGAAQPTTYYAAPPSGAAPQGPTAAAQVPPMMPIHDMTKEAGFGNKFGRYNTNPVGMVIHHTGGGQTVDQVINIYKQRNFPANFVIDKQGQIYQTLPNGYQGQHIQNGTGLLGQGRSNANMEGVEIIADNDKDVNPAQQAAAANLVAQRAAMWGYNPVTSTFGHGELNPGHKEPSEGLTVTNGIRDGSLAVPDYTKQIRNVNITAAPGSAPPVPYADPTKFPETLPAVAGQTEPRLHPGYIYSADNNNWTRADLYGPNEARMNGMGSYVGGVGNVQPGARGPNSGAAQTQPQASAYQIAPGGGPVVVQPNMYLPSPASSLQLPPNWLTTPQPLPIPQQQADVPDLVAGGAM